VSSRGSGNPRFATTCFASPTFHVHVHTSVQVGSAVPAMFRVRRTCHIANYLGAPHLISETPILAQPRGLKNPSKSCLLLGSRSCSNCSWHSMSSSHGDPWQASASDGLQTSPICSYPYFLGEQSHTYRFDGPGSMLPVRNTVRLCSVGCYRRLFIARRGMITQG
jgi:hypothetical protein